MGFVDDDPTFAKVTLDVTADGAQTPSVEVLKAVNSRSDAERRALKIAHRKLSSEYSRQRNHGTNNTVARYLVASQPSITVTILKSGEASVKVHGRAELPDYFDEAAYDRAVDDILDALAAAIAKLE